MHRGGKAVPQRNRLISATATNDLSIIDAVRTRLQSSIIGTTAVPSKKKAEDERFEVVQTSRPKSLHERRRKTVPGGRLLGLSAFGP